MSQSIRAAIYGTGRYTPEKIYDNAHFSKSLDTTDEWITTRTGIKQRRIAAPSQVTSDLCFEAAKAAIENSGLKPDDIDLIVIGTVTGDRPFPSCACFVQNKLGLAEKKCGAFDVAAACSGFLYGVSTAQAYVCSGMAQRVLVVGGEILSRIIDYTDRGSCILFGDGAGAVVIGPERSDGPSHTILSTKIYADGRGADMLEIPAGGSALPTTKNTIDERKHFVRLDGREVFRFGVVAAVDLIRDAMERHNLKKEDVGAIIPHQANIRIIESVSERLDLPMDLFVTNIHAYGNTSAGSIPIALDEVNRANKLPKGKPVIMLAFGAGLTWSSTVVQW